MEDLLVKVSNTYDLPSLRLVQKVERGVLSDNFILQNSESKYFLKTWRFQNEEWLSGVLRIEKYFANHGIPIIESLNCANNQNYFKYEDKFYSLYPYISGTHIEREDIAGESLDSMAEMLATIHLVSRDNPIEAPDSFTWWDTEKTLEKMGRILSVIQKIHNKSEFDQKILDLMTRRHELLIKNTIKSEDFTLPSDTLIHGDYHESNIFFTENQISYVFDLEKAGMAPRVFELVRTIMIAILCGDYSHGNIGRAGQFLATYSEKYPITREEFKSGMEVFYIKGLHSSWIADYYYIKNNNRADIYLENEALQFLYMSENRERLAEELASFL